MSKQSRSVQDKINELIKFNEEHNRFPKTNSEDSYEKSLAKFLSHMYTNYKKQLHNMKDVDNRILLYNFNKNHLKRWKDLKNPNEELQQEQEKKTIKTVKEKIEDINDFIDKYKRIPKTKSEDTEENKLAKTLSHMYQNYKDYSKSMSIENIENRTLFYNFNKDVLKRWEDLELPEKQVEYKKKKNKTVKEKLDDIIQFNKENGRFPKETKTNTEENSLAESLANMYKYYKKHMYAMKNIENRVLLYNFNKDILKRWELKEPTETYLN